ncbi:response regulator [Vallitalea okinawensis]|uniref:response regulator n=1 Tax=Vallitalea okinawensis TaxID=2078660 RepID=UPI000CFE259C|nr:response regulator [Vallitalea okinawensis]
MLKLIIVDDEYLVRKGLISTIDWISMDMEVVGEAEDGEEGLELVKILRPDIIITDIRMPNMNGIEFMEAVRQLYSDQSDYYAHFIILSGFDEFEYAKKAIENGALAYLLKPIDNEVIYDTMKTIIKKIKKQRSTHNYYNKLQQELTSIKRQFIYNLIQGSIHELDIIQEKIKFLDLPFSEDNQLILFLQLDQRHRVGESLTITERNQFQYFLEKNISHQLLLASEYYGLFVQIAPFQWAILLQSMVTDKERLHHQLRIACNSFFKQTEETIDRKGMSNLPKHLTYSIGISQLNQSMLELNQQYKQAIQAADHKLILDASTLTFYDDLFNTRYRPEIQNAIHYIHKHYQENITIKEAAEALHLSASHLMRLFKSEVSVTFNDYLTNYRIKLAEELLMRGEYKVYEVANKVGYYDVKYFSQVFKKRTGLTPREYKQKKGNY